MYLFDHLFDRASGESFGRDICPFRSSQCRDLRQCHCRFPFLVPFAAGSAVEAFLGKAHSLCQSFRAGALRNEQAQRPPGEQFFAAESLAVHDPKNASKHCFASPQNGAFTPRMNPATFGSVSRMTPSRTSETVRSEFRTKVPTLLSTCLRSAR